MLSTNNKEIVDFYNQYPHLEFEQINLFTIKFLKNILSQVPNENLDQQSIIHLLQNITNKCSNMQESLTTVSTQQFKMESHISDIHKQIIDSISLQLYSTKDAYIKELEKFIQTGKTSELQYQQDIANQNLEKILDKMHIHFGDNFLSSFTKEVKQFNHEIHQEFQKAITTNSQDNLISRFESSISNKYDNLHKSILQLNQEVRTEVDKLNYTDDITVIKSHFERQKNSSNKGSDGEIKLEGILNDIFPSANIENTTGKSKSGDFIVERPDASPIMFENKDYANNVPICEVEKFIRDVENLNMNAIFLSQNSGISRKDDFHIDIHNNKIIIFLHNVNYSSDKIKIVVSMLDHLSFKLDQIGHKGDVIPESVLISINKEFNFFMQQRGLLFDTLRKFNKDLTKQITELELPELNILLSSKYASSDAIPYKCIHCDKIYKNAKSLAAHVKKCSQKPP